MHTNCAKFLTNIGGQRQELVEFEVVTIGCWGVSLIYALVASRFNHHYYAFASFDHLEDSQETRHVNISSFLSSDREDIEQTISFIHFLPVFFVSPTFV